MTKHSVPSRKCATVPARGIGRVYRTRCNQWNGNNNPVATLSIETYCMYTWGNPTETGVGTWPLFKCVCVCVCVCVWEASLKLTQDWTSSSLHPEGPVALRSSAAENRKNRGKEKITSDAATHRITMIAAVPVSRSRTQTVNSGRDASHTRRVKRNILNRDQAW